MDDFITMAIIWGWKLGFDGSSPERPDVTWYATWKAQHPVGRINVFGPAAPQYWVNMGQTTVPTTWAAYETMTYANNNDPGVGTTWRPENTWAPYQSQTALVNEVPNSSAWRAGWRNSGAAQTPNTMTSYSFFPNSDIMILRAALAHCVDFGAPGAQAAWDTFMSYDHSDIDYNTNTQGANVFEPQYAFVPL
jgi:hypothetical protein